MGSKPLKQKVSLVLCTMGMRGDAVTKRDVVKAVNDSASNEDFDIMDIRWARELIIEREVTIQMKAPLPDNVLTKLRGAIPADLVPILDGSSGWICLGKGRDAPWVFSFTASPEDWQLSADLKTEHANNTRKAANRDRDIANFLAARGMKSLSEIGLVPVD